MGYYLSNLRHLNAEYYSGVFILWKSVLLFHPPTSILLLCGADAGHILLICTAARYEVGAILTLFGTLSKAYR